MTENSLFRQHGHTNEFIDAFDFVSVLSPNIVTHDTHSFLLLFPNFHAFSAYPLQMINI